MRMTDGTKTIEITMCTFDGINRSPDFSHEFFEAPYDEEADAYRVQDVDYCIERANDWRDGVGDFYDPEAEEDDRAERMVYVEDVQ